MLVELNQVTKTYTTPAGAVSALSDVTLSMAAGEFVAVTGASGCGKSTLLLTLGGLLRPNHGEVLVDGTNLYNLTPNERAQFRARTIGFVFQQFYLIPYLNVVDNVLAARLGLPAGDRHEVRTKAEQVVEQLGLRERMHHRSGQLSTGERQRTALARALLNQPKLLLADEPTGNLDAENAEIVFQHLKQFTKNGGAVLVVTHDQQAAERAERIVRLKSGRKLN